MLFLLTLSSMGVAFSSAKVYTAELCASPQEKDMSFGETYNYGGKDSPSPLFPSRHQDIAFPPLMTPKEAKAPIMGISQNDWSKGSCGGAHSPPQSGSA